MTEPALASFGGAAAPEGLVDDLRRVAAFPEAARAELWSVLGPSLRDQLDPRLEAALTNFGRTHGIADAELAHGLKAARHLIREAARVGAGAERVEADLGALLGDDGGVLWGALAPRYEEAARALRFDIVRDALLGHGAVYLGTSWRVDSVMASEKGQNLRTPVALLTVKYRRDGKDEALTLQALPEDLARLRDAVTAALAAARPDTQTA